MNAIRSIFERIGRVALAHLTLACALPLTMTAQNLVKNPGFENPATGVPPGTTVSYTSFCNAGKSAAAVWLVWVNTCGSDISTTLVPSTALSGGNYMLHVVTTASENGIYTNFASHPETTSSVWVYVNSGCVGMGTGDGAETSSTDEMTCVTGKWIHFYKVPNGVTPATEFIVYSIINPEFPTGTGGADFYVDNAQVVAPLAGAPLAEPKETLAEPKEN